MFNDKIKLYKGVNNPIQFKIRDLDRVTKTPSNVSFTLLDKNKVILLQTYLELQENDKKYTLTLDKQTLSEIEPSTGYYFILTFLDEDNNPIPLFVDHDFNVHGKVEVHNAVTPVQIESFSNIEEVKYDYLDDKVPSNYHFIIDERFNVDDKTIKFVFTSSKEVDLHVFKHRRKYYPVLPKEMKQWELDQSYYNIDEKQILSLPKGHYMFVVGSEDKQFTVELFYEFIL